MAVPPRCATEVLKQAASIMFWAAADVRAFGYNFHGAEVLASLTAGRPASD